MKKQILLKILALVVLNVFVMSLGMTTFAATQPTVSPRWSTLISCSYLFELDESLQYYDVVACGGATVVGSNIYGYVKVELERLVNGTWKNFATWEDQDHMGVTIEEYVAVTPGYSYRLHVTHKALDANDNVLETYSYYSDYYVTSLPRN